MIWIVYVAAWISTSAAAIAGMYLTGSAWCLWARLLPALYAVKNDRNDEENKNDKG